MNYKLKILKLAIEDIKQLEKSNPKLYLRCAELIKQIAETPRSGIGKPERLKYFDKEVYSRRLTQKDRIIYTIYEKTKEIEITSCLGHYD